MDSLSVYAEVLDMNVDALRDSVEVLTSYSILLSRPCSVCGYRRLNSVSMVF